MGRTVRPRSTQTGNASQAWTLLAVPPGSTAFITSPSSVTCAFTPDLPGTYRVQLITNDGGTGNVQILVIRCRFDVNGLLVNQGLVMPGFGETSPESNYPGNEDGWGEPLDELLAYVLTLTGGGGSLVPVEDNARALRAGSAGKMRSIGVTTTLTPAAMLSEVTGLGRVDSWVSGPGTAAALALGFNDGTFVCLDAITMAQTNAGSVTGGGPVHVYCTGGKAVFIGATSAKIEEVNGGASPVSITSPSNFGGYAVSIPGTGNTEILLITAPGDNTIYYYNLTSGGSVNVSYVGPSGSTPTGICVDNEGNVWVNFTTSGVASTSSLVKFTNNGSGVLVLAGVSVTGFLCNTNIVFDGRYIWGVYSNGINAVINKVRVADHTLYSTTLTTNGSARSSVLFDGELIVVSTTNALIKVHPDTFEQKLTQAVASTDLGALTLSADGKAVFYSSLSTGTPGFAKYKTPLVVELDRLGLGTASAGQILYKNASGEVVGGNLSQDVTLNSSLVATVKGLYGVPLDNATMPGAVDGDFIQKMSGKWSAITAAALSAAIVISSFPAGSNGQVLTTAVGVATWAQVVDANVASAAAIAGTKISPVFGSQNVSTTGTGSFGGTTVTSLTDSGLAGSGAGYATLSNAGLLGFTSTIPAAGVTPGTADQLFDTNHAGTTAEWFTPSGDISFLSHAFTVNKIQGVAISGTPAAGNTLGATSPTAATWSALNLAGGANYVSGQLPVGNLANGTAAQLLITNSGATSPAWVTVSGDSSITAAGVMTNAKINGTSVPASPTATYVLQATSTTAATWVAPSTLTAGGVTPGTAGQVYITNATPAAVWTSLVSVELTHGRFTSGGTGASDWSAMFGPFPGFEASNAGLWFLSHGTAASVSNYAFQQNSSGVYVNDGATGAITFQFSNSTTAVYTMPGHFYYGGTSAAAPLNVDWSTSTAPFIQSGTSATSLTVGTHLANAAFVLQYDNALAALSIDKATSFAAGAANWSVPLVVKSGGDAVGNSGVLVTRGGLAGSNGIFLIGAWNSTDGALWAGSAAASPTTSNYSFLSDGNSTWFNAPNGSSTGVLNFFVGNTTQIGYWSTSTLYVGTGLGGTTQILLTAPSTTPSIQSGSSATQFTFGTNLAGAGLLFQTDAAVNILQLYGGTQGGIALGTHVASAGHIRSVSGLVWNNRNHANTADANILVWDTGDNLTLGDGTNTANVLLKASGSGGSIQLQLGLVNYLTAVSSAVFINGSNSAAPLQLSFATATTPTIQSGSSATSLTIGTTNTAQTTITINATQAAATTSGGNITIAPQAGGATSGVPGSLILNIAAPNGGSNEGFVVVERATTAMVRLGPYTGAPTSFAAIYFLDGGSPSSTNWAFLGNASDTYFNAPGANMYFKIANNTIAMGATSQHVDFGGASSASVTPALTIDFSGGTTAPVVKTGNTTSTTTLKIGITAMTADVLPGNLTVQGAYAWSSAVTNQTAGNIVFDVGPPVGSSTVEGKFQFTRNGSVIGQLAAADAVPTYGRLWLGSTAPTSANWVIQADANSITDFNAPSGGAIGFVIGGATFVMEVQATTLWIGGSVSASPVLIDWTTSTAPYMHGGSSATSLAVGTNNSSGQLLLQAAAAVTVETLSGAGVAWSKATSQTGAFNFSTSTGKVYWPVDTSGGAVTGTLPAASSVAVGTTWYVQDSTGSFQANTFTLAPNGTDKINGTNLSTPFNTNWGTVRIWTNGTQWFARGM